MQIDDYYLMEQALDEAKKGLTEGEVPVGAVICDQEGEIISRAHNRPIALSDPTAHAEILALRSACSLLGNYRIKEAILVVTIEPCVMCMGAALNARISRLLYGAADPKSGAAGSVYSLHQDNRLNHSIEVISGVMEEECRKIMKGFFHGRRGG
ncbi:MAG: nucleoside deaminase [Deltaproteobacteria bacterium]|nr:nucleoside deaminase [Deltaproteobacteria bacterium]MBW2136480.1 nucleoside deaminase [Deltaproteobacteria bacterium]